MWKLLSNETRQMESLETLARAIMGVADTEGLDFDTLKKQVPKQFWNKVLKQLGGAHNSRGEPWNPKSLAAQWMRKKDNLVSIIEKLQRDGKAGSGPKEATAVGAQCSDQSTTDEHAEEFSTTKGGPTAEQRDSDSHIRELIQDELTKKTEDLLQFVEERLQKRFQNRISSGVAESDVPPIPRRVRRKMEGNTGHVSAKVDMRLADLFEKDRHERFQGNASRCLTWILWNFYGKPLLSFQSSRDDEEPHHSTANETFSSES